MVLYCRNFELSKTGSTFLLYSFKRLHQPILEIVDHCFCQLPLFTTTMFHLQMNVCALSFAVWWNCVKNATVYDPRNIKYIVSLCEKLTDTIITTHIICIPGGCGLIFRQFRQTFQNLAKSRFLLILVVRFCLEIV